MSITIDGVEYEYLGYDTIGNKPLGSLYVNDVGGVGHVSEYSGKNTIKLFIKKARARAIKGGVYFYIDTSSHGYAAVMQSVDSYNSTACNRLNTGNYYLTYDEARVVANRINDIFKETA